MTTTEPVQTAIRWWRNGDHPADAVGQEVPVDSPGTSGETYRRQEGAVVRFFRHPIVDGTTVHETCGREWHVHGWIDQGPDGLIVCPGDLVIDCGNGLGNWWAVRSDLSAAERIIGEGVYLVSAADYDTEMPPEVHAWLTRAKGFLPAADSTIEVEAAEGPAAPDFKRGDLVVLHPRAVHRRHGVVVEPAVRDDWSGKWKVQVAVVGVPGGTAANGVQVCDWWAEDVHHATPADLNWGR